MDTLYTILLVCLLVVLLPVAIRNTRRERSTARGQRLRVEQAQLQCTLCGSSNSGLSTVCQRCGDSLPPS